MSRWFLFLPFVALSFFIQSAVSVNSTVFMTKFSQFPQCGTDCAIEIVPTSNCKSLTNFTCLCTDEPIKAIMTDCVYDKCTGMETFELAKLNAEGCETPERSRRAVLLGLIPIEVVVIISFLLRFYSRKVTIGKFDRDDYVMFCVLILYLLFAAVANLAYFQGFGVDIWTVDANKVDVAMKLFYFSNSLYIIIMELTKVSILMFYLRVFPNSKFRIATYITLITLISCTVLFTGLQIFQCMPIRYNWLGWRGGGGSGEFGRHHCIDINRFAYAAGGTMIAQDAIILLLPLPWLIKLNTSMRNKIGIIVMFSMGIFILITSCIRLRFLFKYARTVNPTWDYTDQLVWSALEIAVSILVVNIPAIRVLFVKKINPAVRSAFSSRHQSSAAGQEQGDSGYLKRTRSFGSGKRKGMGMEDDPEEPKELTHFRTESSASKTSLSNNRTSLSIAASEDAPPPRLELGDKLKGDVHTVISAGPSPLPPPPAPLHQHQNQHNSSLGIGIALGGASTDDLRRPSTGSSGSRHERVQSGASEMSMGSRILVETTTTRWVAHGELSDMKPVNPSSPLGGRAHSGSTASGRSFSMPRPGRPVRGMSFGSTHV